MTTTTNTTVQNNGTGAYTGGIPLNVTLHAWPVPQVDPDIRQLNQTSSGVVRSTESAKNYTNSLHNLNATGYVAIEDDLTDTGFSDVQTFLLASIATVIPLLIAVATIFGIRRLWRRYRARKSDGYEGVLQKEESTEPLEKLTCYFAPSSLPQELKTSESQFTVTPGEDISSPSPQLLTPKSNGSVITMTLKNNHLIVETEETENTPSGIIIESKGTTTKFVTSTAPDFKADASYERQQNFKKSTLSNTIEGSTDDILASTDHGALVHCPPEETEDELDKGSCNTGLSQSDLSVSSTESQNPSYRYGNQMGYDSGGYGYPEYSGYSTTAAKATIKQSHSNIAGPKENRIYMRSSSVMEAADLAASDVAKSGPQFKDILMSDIQAREKIVADDEEKRYQEEQRILGNGQVSATNQTSSGKDSDSQSCSGPEKSEQLTVGNSTKPTTEPSKSDNFGVDNES